MNHLMTYSKEVSKSNFRLMDRSTVVRAVREEKESEEKGSVGKMIKVRGKVERPQHTDFFHCFVALEGRKVGSPKRQVRSHLGR